MRILILDGDMDECQNTINIIYKTFWNPDIRIAHSVMEAKEVLESTSVDLVLVEIKLPCHNGYRAIKMIRTFAPNTHIAVLTSSKFGIDCYLALSLGADDIFIKSTRPGNSLSLIGYLKKVESNVSVHAG